MTRLALAFTHAIVALWLIASASGQTKSFTDRMLNRDIGDSRHFVSFCGEDDGFVGHAFLLLSSQDEQHQVCRVDAAVGFWPKDENGKKRLKALFGARPGELRNELERAGALAATTCRLTVPLTSEEFEILKIKFGAFAGKKYELLSADCVTLCAEVARDVLKLSVPDRDALFAEYKKKIKALVEERAAGDENVQLERFPVEYIRTLSDMNAK